MAKIKTGPHVLRGAHPVIRGKVRRKKDRGPLLDTGPSAHSRPEKMASAGAYVFKRDDGLGEIEITPETYESTLRLDVEGNLAELEERISVLE